MFSDELNHASIIDGCRLPRADRFVYRHRDPEHLAWGLRRARGRAALIVTDSVFSMDGDVAPLTELVGLARRHKCRLIVDEAHATGAVGPGGRGSVAAAGPASDVDVIVGTLGKALGSYGAYVCASPEIIELLVNTARPFIFSTGLPPPSVGAAAAALELLQSEPDRVERLQPQRRGPALRAAGGGARHRRLPHPDHSDRRWRGHRATALCERVLERGLFAQAIRPPTVPQGTSRLRLSVMATHRRRAAPRGEDARGRGRELALPAGEAGALHEAA